MKQLRYKYLYNLCWRVDVDAEANSNSDYGYACQQARTVAEGIIATVQLMSHSGLPCYSRGSPIANLQKRFHLEMTDAQAASFMHNTIRDAYDKVRSRNFIGHEFLAASCQIWSIEVPCSQGVIPRRFLMKLVLFFEWIAPKNLIFQGGVGGQKEQIPSLQCLAGEIADSPNNPSTFCRTLLCASQISYTERKFPLWPLWSDYWLDCISVTCH